MKTHKIIISLKKKTLGFVKYLMQHQLNLNHFNLVNEISKSVKIKEKENDSPSFEIKARIK